MAARSCLDCELHFPNIPIQFKVCPLCEEELLYDFNTEPNLTIVEGEAIKGDPVGYRMDREAPSPTHAHRVERFTHLGFSVVDANLLALAKVAERDSKGRDWMLPLNWLHVQAQLEAGASHALLVSIYA